MKVAPFRFVMVLLMVCGALHVAMQLQHFEARDSPPQAAPPKNLTHSKNSTANSTANKPGSRGHVNRRGGPWGRTFRAGGRDNEGRARKRASASRDSKQRWQGNNETRGSGAAKAQERRKGSKDQGDRHWGSAKWRNTTGQFRPRLVRHGGQKSKSEADRLGIRQRPTNQSRAPARRGFIRRQPTDLSTAKHRGRGGGQAAWDLHPWTARNSQQNATSECAGRAASKDEPPLISVLTSTTSSRRKFWKNLLRNFQHQAYPNKELIILGNLPL